MPGIHTQNRYTNTEEKKKDLTNDDKKEWAYRK